MKDEKVKDERIKKSLKYSILDGSFYSAMVGFGESFFSPFAIFLKATNFELGLLTTLPLTIGSLFQLYTKKLLKIFKTRKKLILTLVVLQSLLYIPIALLFFFSTIKVIHLLLFVCIYMAFGMLASPVWISWMGDLVDENKRGKYFGKRNQLIGIVAFITYLLGGYILQRFTDKNIQLYGFIVLFCVAMLSRWLSFYFLFKQYEPEYNDTQEIKFGFRNFVKDAKDNNYGRFVLYLVLINFALYISVPFFNPYMINELHFNYITFTFITGVMLIMKYMMMPVWGGFIDRYGTKKVLAITGFLIPFPPLLWIFNQDIWYLICVQLFSGFVWSGFEMATFTFLFDATLPENRTQSISYYNVLNGIAILIGGVIGGIILTNNYSVKFYFILFAVSALLRLLISIIFLPKIKEVRRVEEISNKNLLLKAINGLPGRTLFFDVFNLTVFGVNSTVKTTVKGVNKVLKTTMDEVDRNRKRVLNKFNKKK